MTAPTISILIPCYNEHATIAEVVRRAQRAPLPAGCQRELIVVDDGSDAPTKAALAGMSGIVLVTLPVNRGKGYALREGLKRVTGDVVVVQDADLEYDPNDYPALIEPLITGQAVVVYGSRFLSGINSRSKYYYGVKALTWLANRLYGSRLTDEATGYKVFTTALLRSLPLQAERFEFCPEVTARLLKQGVPIREVPITYRPRTTGQGKKIAVWDGIIAAWILISHRWK